MQSGVAAFAAAPPKGPEMTDKYSFEAQRLAATYTGAVSFAGKNLSNGKTITFRADRVMPTASTIKLPILVELLHQVEQGRLDLDTQLTLKASDQVGGSGVLKHMSPGAILPLRDVALLMIILSDNTATNMVLDLTGIAPVNAEMKKLGLTSTTLKNKVDFTAIGSDVRNFAEASAADYVILLEAIATSKGVSPASSALIWGMLSRQHYLDLLPRQLPYNPYAGDLGGNADFSVGGKTGFFPGFRADAMIAGQGGQTVVMTAFAYGDDMSFLPDNAIAVFLGKLGKTLFEELTA